MNSKYYVLIKIKCKCVSLLDQEINNIELSLQNIIVYIYCKTKKRKTSTDIYIKIFKTYFILFYLCLSVKYSNTQNNR